jgi:hypothetical protein
MSEQEFENWLALLSGLLKLSPEQRQNISDELRSHLEERMEDLIDAGSSREEAIAAALAEFGDTAALAHHFTSIAHQKRRRLMRYTYGMIASVTCAILVLAAFWPAPEVQNVAAQSETAALSGPLAVAQPVKESDSLDALNRARIEAILAEPIPEIKFQNMPLREVLAELQTLTGINMYFDPEELGDAIDPEDPVTVDLDENSVTYESLIKEYVLGENILTFVIRHNSLMIMTYDKYLAYPPAVQLVIYNCRDLLLGFPLPSAIERPVENAGGEDANSLDGASLGETGPAQPEPDEKTVTGIENREQQLADLIRSTVGNEDFPWADDSNSAYDEQIATIQTYNGLLIIRTLPEIHEQVRQFLRLLRESTEEQPWPAEVVERESSTADR